MKKATKKPADGGQLKVRDPEKYAYAEQLYMQQVPQEEIARRVGTSTVTLSKWKQRGEWEAKRAAKLISRDTLITKTMARMNEMLDRGEDFSADAFAKAAKQLKDLQRGASIDDLIESLSKFGTWLIQRAPIDKRITEDFVRTLTALQDTYITERLGAESKKQIR